MKLRSLVITLMASTVGMAVAHADTTTLTGAGATFPAPIYNKWAELYTKIAPVQINYQSIGSGAGIKQIEAGTVDFGASDKPLSSDDLTKNGLTQFPTVLGAVVPIINIPGIKDGELKLTGPLLAEIYMGKIKKWNDPAITKLNPGLKLPALDISVVHRSDGSGTTFIFTNYLSKISPEWAKSLGSDVSVAWPVGVGGKGSEGVTLYVKQISGGIGYAEYAYAMSNHLSAAKLKNKANHFVAASNESVKAAAASADWSNPSAILTEQPGAKAWPISGATYILLHTKVTDANKTKAILSFFDWGYHHGSNAAMALQYVPIPDSVVSIVEKAWKTTLKDEKGQPVWNQ